jgi:hypothetical protein
MSVREDAVNLDPQLRQRQAEQEAFDAQLDELLQYHLGKWVLFGRGRALGVFETYSGAFRFGLHLFRTRRVFLVARVQDPPWKLVGLQVADLLNAA